MTRKIINVCFVFALMLGNWGGVLAAAVCPHMRCETAAPVAGEASDAHGGHGMDCDHVVKPEEHSGDVTSHEGHGDGNTGGDRRQSDQSDLAGLHRAAREGHDQSCSHCVSRPQAPPSQNSEQQSNSVKRGESFVAPAATAAQVESPVPVYLRKITPAQHAPPGSSDRHILLNIFRI